MNNSLLAAVAFAFGANASALASAPDARPESVTAIAFGDDRTLFVGDADGGRVFAYRLPESEAARASAAFNVLGFGARVAERFGVLETEVLYSDVAVHPRSGEAFVALTVIRDGSSEPGVIRIGSSGEISDVALETLESTFVELSATPDDGVTFWRDIPATTFTITDMDYASGSLYVSGLSNGEFASTLRRIPFPFTDRSNTSSIEIYHAVHNQVETRAPIRAMAVTTLGGEETVVAAYTCTPLVTIPTDQLLDGARVRGKTVAELGYGNTPLEVVRFDAMSMSGASEPFVLVVNRERAADLIRLADLEEGHEGDGLEVPVQSIKAGVPTQSTPLAGVVQMADQDPQYLLALQRNLDTGSLDLVSFRKGAYLRLSNFVSEYNFADYEYTPAVEQIRQFQNMLKVDEGYPELIRDGGSEK
ncbi:MAG: hypothetical protein AAFR38_08510 [Planctomycetota bacterium]